MIKRSLLALPLGLMACGGSGNSDFPVRLEPDVVVSTTETELTVVSGDDTITVPLSEDGVTQGFIGGLNSDGFGSTAAHFENEAATATIATLIEEDRFFAITSFERLVAVETPLTGTATMAGTVVSALSPVANAEPVDFDLVRDTPFLSQLDETITLNVDFDERTIDGQIVAGTVDLFGLGLPFRLSDDINTIDLLATPIQSDGDFDGVARYANNPDAEDGTYGGLIAGQGGSTVVGAFAVPGRTGVFQATAE